MESVGFEDQTDAFSSSNESLRRKFRFFRFETIHFFYIWGQLLILFGGCEVSSYLPLLGCFYDCLLFHSQLCLLRVIMTFWFLMLMLLDFFYPNSNSNSLIFLNVVVLLHILVSIVHFEVVYLIFFSKSTIWTLKYLKD